MGAMVRKTCLLLFVSALGASLSARAEPPAFGLLVAQSEFEVSASGKVLPKPKDALLEVLLPRDGLWESVRIEDPDSRVFHKAMVYDPGVGPPGILTLGGSDAKLKLWRRGDDGFVDRTLWSKDFGGKFSRMRDAEAADLYGDGRASLAVATHDQGVVAIVRPRDDGGFDVLEIDREPKTFVHEIEIGDLDGDGVLEVYATPSEPNRLDGRAQSGRVVRYVPKREEGRKVVADLGDRHAKEILVTDLDGDGRDELYVSVEAVSGGKLEIRRYVAGTDPAGGEVIAALDDKLCRFLTAGDLDGDGVRELVAATSKAGIWRLVPPSAGKKSWRKEVIARDSSGFEHAAILADLDGDGQDELYVASDKQGEVRRYLMRNGRYTKDVLSRRTVPDSVFTWNLMPVPLDLVPDR